MQEISWLNIAALVWFVFLWLGYARFAHYKARRTEKSISSVMNLMRKRWMGQLLKREIRIPDAALIANLERSVTFLASTSMLILAGLLTSLAATEQIQTVLLDVPLYVATPPFLMHFKQFVLIIIYSYAFFTFSWSMRQYGFATVIIGAAPLTTDDISEEEKNRFIRGSAKVIDLAAHTYNYGLRAFYFSLSVLAWFVNDWLFIFAATLVVCVLYIREFHSRPLKEMTLL